MAQSIREVMTPNPATVPATATVADAARLMREQHIGDVLVTDNSHIRGIVTDRDIAVRAVAEGKDPSKTKVGDIASTDLVTASPDDSIEDAARKMRDKALRRIPVVEGDQPVGVVSLGDLAMERDSDSPLAEISEAPPND
jgi:CBS domain-containing protein